MRIPDSQQALTLALASFFAIATGWAYQHPELQPKLLDAVTTITVTYINRRK